MTSKSELRAAARARRATLAAALPDFAQRIAAFALALALPPGALVASFWPLRNEADPRLLVRALARKIALPCIAGSNTALVFRLWREGDVLESSALGTHEPSAAAPKLVPSVVLVPLLAFDAEGFRLGYGGGYYDRTLAELRKAGGAIAIGVAYDGQETQSLPREPHDEPLDMVVTERGVRRFARG
jgi:5-formyltetrahydrofolate cyclo-ligase